MGRRPYGPEYAHGTCRRYWRGCRCVACRGARAIYRETLRARREEGPQIVSARVVRAHLRKLAPLGHRRIAALAGLSPSQVALIRTGKAKTIRRFTAECLLGVKPAKAPGARVSSWRTKKLLAALYAEGFTRRRLTRLLGLSDTCLRCYGKTVRISTAAAVETLYQNIMRDDFDWRHGKPIDAAPAS